MAWSDADSFGVGGSSAVDRFDRVGLVASAIVSAQGRFMKKLSKLFWTIVATVAFIGFMHSVYKYGYGQGANEQKFENQQAYLEDYFSQMCSYFPHNVDNYFTVPMHGTNNMIIYGQFKITRNTNSEWLKPSVDAIHPLRY